MTQTQTVEVEDASIETSIVMPDKASLTLAGGNVVSVYDADEHGNDVGDAELFAALVEEIEAGDLTAVEVEVHSSELTPDARVVVTGVA